MVERIGTFVVLLLIASLSQALHLPGGNITYRCLGGNNYEVELALWRECSGTAMMPQSLQFQNDCGVVFGVNNLTPVEVENVSQLCGSVIGSTDCDGGPLAGIEYYTYRTTLFLSPCNGWTISWSVCCRNNALNIVSSQGLYLEAKLNNLAAGCDASPSFTGPGIPVVCVDEAVTHDMALVDPDGDSLRYSFIDARFSSPDILPVIYTGGFTGAMPYTGMDIDPFTGQITFTPTEQGYIVVAVLVESWNAAGVYIGSVMRDFPFIVRACGGNAAPDIDAGAIEEVVGGSTLGPRHLVACTGSEVCFQLEFSDPDAGQTLNYTTTVDQVLTGAEVTVMNAVPLTLSICWTAPEMPVATQYFTITVWDDNCPYTNYRSYTYTVETEIAPNAGAAGSLSYCPLEGPTLLFPLLTGTPQSGGSWSAPDTAPHNGVFDPAVDAPGEYTYTVFNSAGCSASASVITTLLPASEPGCILLGTPDVDVRSFTVFAEEGGPGTFHWRMRDGVPYAPTGLTVRDVHGRTVHTMMITMGTNAGRFTLPEQLTDGVYTVSFHHGKQLGQSVRILLFR